MADEKETPSPVETPPAPARPLPHIPGTINNPPYVPPPTPSPSTAGVENADMPAPAAEPPSPPPPPPAPEPKEPEPKKEDKDEDNGDKRAARHSRDRGR